MRFLASRDQIAKGTGERLSNGTDCECVGCDGLARDMSSVQSQPPVIVQPIDDKVIG